MILQHSNAKSQTIHVFGFFASLLICLSVTYCYCYMIPVYDDNFDYCTMICLLSIVAPLRMDTI